MKHTNKYFSEIYYLRKYCNENGITNYDYTFTHSYGYELLLPINDMEHLNENIIAAVVDSREDAIDAITVNEHLYSILTVYRANNEKSRWYIYKVQVFANKKVEVTKFVVSPLGYAPKIIYHNFVEI